MTLYPKLIIDALTNVMYPGTKKNIIESEMLADDIRIDGMNHQFQELFGLRLKFMGFFCHIYLPSFIRNNF